MRISGQNRTEATNMIKGARTCLLITLLLAGVLAIWVPFHLKLLTIAVIMGGLAGGITWFSWTREKHLFLFGCLKMGIPAAVLSISGRILVPGNLSNLGSIMLILMQSFFVMFAVYMAIILLGAMWFKKEVADIFTPTQPPNLPE